VGENEVESESEADPANPTPAPPLSRVCLDLRQDLEIDNKRVDEGGKDRGRSRGATFSGTELRVMAHGVAATQARM